MHFNALFLLCAFLAVCSELAAYHGNKYTARGRSLQRAMSLVLGRPEYGHPTYSQKRYYHRTQAAGLEQPAEIYVRVPDVHEENVHETQFEHEQEVHEMAMFPSESEVPLESLVAPLGHEEFPLFEEPVVYDSAPRSDLSVLYDYMYPMVLRKCLASAIYSSMGSEGCNVNYSHQMKRIDHHLIQIAGLDTLEELRRNLTVVAAARRRFSRLPKMASGCVFHFNEIDAEMQAAREDFLMSYEESSSEESFLLENKYILKHERLVKKDFMMHRIIRKLYELLRNQTPMYNVILALDVDVENYINHWNTKYY